MRADALKVYFNVLVKVFVGISQYLNNVINVSYKIDFFFHLNFFKWTYFLYFLIFFFFKNKNLFSQLKNEEMNFVNIYILND